MTGYNSELSDRPFKEKLILEGGFKESPLWLNRSLSQFTTWYKDTIEERAYVLADRALTVWQSPSLPENVWELYGSKEKGASINNYTVDQFASSFSSETRELYELLKTRILNIDSSVKEEYRKLYIAYKSANHNFVDITPTKQHIKMWLNCKFGEILDPHHLGKDVTAVGHWGNGDIEVIVSPETDIELVLELVKQSFRLNSDAE